MVNFLETVFYAQVDTHGHVMPKSFAEALNQSYSTEELRELAPLTYFGDIDSRVRVLDKHKIDKQVLTLRNWLVTP